MLFVVDKDGKIAYIGHPMYLGRGAAEGGRREVEAKDDMAALEKIETRT